MATLILLCWLLQVVLNAAFLVLLGWSWKARDRAMTWHLWVWVAGDVLETAALLAAGITLFPAAAVYLLLVAAPIWRIVLVVQTRRRTRTDS